MGGVGVGTREFAESVEDAVLECESAFVGGSVALDEVLVGVGLVELDHLDGSRVLAADEAPGDSAGDEGLPGAGWALEDEVLAGFDGGEEAGEVGGGDEKVLVGVVGGVGGVGVHWVRFGFLLTDRSAVLHGLGRRGFWLPEFLDRREVEVNLLVRILVFEASTDSQQSLVELDLVGCVKTLAMMQSADDPLLALVGDDRLEIVGEEQKQECMSEHATGGKLRSVQPGREIPCTVEEGFALVWFQRKPSEHGYHEEAEFHPGKCVVRCTRVDDSRSEYCVVQEIMTFREVSLRPLPNLADPTSLLDGSHGLPELNQVVHPCHFGPKALRVRGAGLKLALELYHERV